MNANDPKRLSKDYRHYLTNCLKDGRLKLRNNCAERSVKIFTIYRKNFLFAHMPGGAEGRSMIFTTIQTAIGNGLDPD